MRFRMKVIEIDGRKLICVSYHYVIEAGVGVAMALGPDGKNEMVTLTATQWNTLPFHYFEMQEEAPRHVEATVPPPRPQRDGGKH